MKILWFANTPCGASELLAPNLNVGGWLKALEEQLVCKEGVELFICFYWKYNIPPFKHKQTHYYPIYHSKYYNIINRVFIHTNDSEDKSNLLRVIETVNPDIIHIHGTEENFGLVQEATNIPIVISLQGILSPYSEKYFSGIPAFRAFLYEGLKVKLLFNSEIWSYARIKKNALREKKILSKAGNILGRTDWDRRVSTVLAPSSRYFLGDEILRQSFYSNDWNKSTFSKPIQIVTTMSGGLYKGLETIVKTAAILSQTPGFNFEWTVIGQKENDILPKIVKRWLKIEYKKLNINLVGNKNEKQMVDIICNSDIYCQLSHIENSPNSVCEAMLLGIPVIASFAGGTDSILENRKEGILVQDGDPYSYAGAIIEMSSCFEKSLELAKAAKKRAHKRHNANDIVERLISTYQEISFQSTDSPTLPDFNNNSMGV